MKEEKKKKKRKKRIKEGEERGGVSFEVHLFK